MPGYKHFTTQPSTSQMPLASSDVNSSPESIVSIRSVPVEYGDCRLDLPHVITNTQPGQETNTDTATGRSYGKHSNDQPRSQGFSLGTRLSNDNSMPINFSESLIEDCYDSSHNVNQRKGSEPPRGPFRKVSGGELHGIEWRPSVLKSGSSKQWVDQVDADLKRCIAEEKVIAGSSNTESTLNIS